MLKEEIRLRILSLMIPKASQLGITDPEIVIGACSQFEKYVVGSDFDDVSEDSLTSITQRRRGPRQGKS